ncbi:hypothetical protein ACQCVK_10655 [Rossellomorea vietnamensis]|uniref:hypothetical protein n=1 Tax=Rossellomorea vietnamensis TaxID=218284 RepID=UPI003CEDF60A
MNYLKTNIKNKRIAFYIRYYRQEDYDKQLDAFFQFLAVNEVRLDEVEIFEDVRKDSDDIRWGLYEMVMNIENFDFITVYAPQFLHLNHEEFLRLKEIFIDSSCDLIILSEQREDFQDE